MALKKHFFFGKSLWLNKNNIFEFEFKLSKLFQQKNVSI